ncbi:NACHT N-terminal helical domain 7-containing protein [Lentzea terrae]|uniref:NACHT N-terminal helical domain 7-containing protein n=1 Tax=Lentzea terrae TaxID=2200761 RepID=UPI000DD3D6ED|nr:AAA family ATPase [Lentzea terrae]
MSRPALFSYEGALRVLGKYDRPWLDATDTFLGVGILVGGAIEPNVLDLVDPKNEATACVRKILDGVTDKLTGLSGKYRQELIAAAHTIIAVTAVFDAYREEIGKKDFAALEITDREKFRIFNVAPPDKKKEASALPGLTSIDVPAPGPTRGFHENLNGDLDTFFGRATLDVCQFIVTGLAAAPRRLETVEFTQAVKDRARASYTDQYVRLAATVPEFEIWFMLGEHAATRATLADTRTESLELFSRLLSLLSAGKPTPRHEYRGELSTHAKAILSETLLRPYSDTSSIDAVFPTVEDGFVTPGYRHTIYREGETRPASHGWWRKNTNPRQDLNPFLAAYLADDESTKLPLLVLGNPGAGKSLLMEVMAARLPAEKFAVVRVQLRAVRAGDRVHEQIATALYETLHKRVEWGQVAAECEKGVTPVILLDGLDELIQASGVHQSTYLRLVQEFQATQAKGGHPTVVVVSSRVLVADRASIPDGVSIVKLEEFDDERIDRWLAAWNNANATTFGFTPVSRDSLGSHLELARQPLLLLMLVIYAADPTTSRLNDQNLSDAELYRRLIDRFVVRQVRKKSAPLPEKAVEDRVADSWWRLGIAAFAMFNRGHQYVTATELNRDLAAFETPEPRLTTSLDTPVEGADRTVEDFFFVHSPKFRDESQPDRRTYEFLHATFGEYLIADMTIKRLTELVTRRGWRSSNPNQRTAPPDDPELYSLISHQVFVKRRPIIEFAGGLFDALPADEQNGVLDVLDDLIRSFHDRALNAPYPGYAPAPITVVSRIAAYSANLVCLRVLLREHATVPINGLFGHHDDSALAGWRSTVNLWKSGLDPESWNELLEEITLDKGETWHIVYQDAPDQYLFREARLTGNPSLEGVLRAGEPFHSDDVSQDRRDQTLISNLSYWIVNVAGTGRTGRAMPSDVNALANLLAAPENGARMSGRTRFIAVTALSREAPRMPRRVVERALIDFGPHTPANYQHSSTPAFELISIMCAHPDLAARDVLPNAELRALFQADPLAATASLALLWKTLNSGDSRIDDQFRAFAELVEEAAAPHAENISFLPVEVFEYLSEPRTTEPTLDPSLLGSLQDIVSVASDEVGAQIMLKLINRFQQQCNPSDIGRFAFAYLESRTADACEADEEALSMLRQVAEQRD